MAHTQSKSCQTPSATSIPKEAQVMTLIQWLFPRTFAKVWDKAYNLGHRDGWNAGTKHQQSTWRVIETRETV